MKCTCTVNVLNIISNVHAHVHACTVHVVEAMVGRDWHILASSPIMLFLIT